MGSLQTPLWAPSAASALESNGWVLLLQLPVFLWSASHIDSHLCSILLRKRESGLLINHTWEALMRFLSTFCSSCVVTSPKQSLQLSQVEVRYAIPPLCPDSSPGGRMLWSCLSSRLWCQLSERQAGTYPSPCCWRRGSRTTTCFSSKSTHNPLCLPDSLILPSV